MKKTKYSEEKILGAVKQLESGRSVKEVARQKPRYGYRRPWAILTRRGWDVNVKRIYRLYREQG